jgi:hypothetical protein
MSNLWHCSHRIKYQIMYTSNRFISSTFSAKQRLVTAKNYVRAQGAPYAMVSNGGALMDPFYRDAAESGHAGRGRTRHLGMDITGAVAGNGGWDDPRRGQTVYAAIKSTMPISEITSARAFNKNTSQNTSINISGTGDATLQEVKIKKQPWSPTDDDSYGGIVGLFCVYSYTDGSGISSQFTLYIEYLHLITLTYLPKNTSGQVASRDYWDSLQRGIGFGPTIESNDNQVVPASTFAGPNYPVVGYLGATQTPHVHVQVAYHAGRIFQFATNMRVNPEVMIL